MKKQLQILLLLTSILFSYSCKKDDDSANQPPDDQNENELITTCKITLTDAAGVAPVFVAQFKDIDGDGGNAPSIFDTIRLKSNTSYFAKLELLDESKTPVVDITAEVKQEGDEHLFVYTPQAINLTVSITDKDSKSLPLGIESNWVTGNSSIGKIKIVLRHQPGIKDGSAAPGDTDMELDFNMLITN